MPPGRLYLVLLQEPGLDAAVCSVVLQFAAVSRDACM